MKISCLTSNFLSAPSTRVLVTVSALSVFVSQFFAEFYYFLDYVLDYVLDYALDYVVCLLDFAVLS